jgi:hypothetical protein
MLVQGEVLHTMSKRYLTFGLEWVFILLIILGGLKALDRGRSLPVYDSDEVSWIFTGYYFNLYFLQFNLFHEDWTDYEAFDHPPFAKYIVGGTLFLKGYTIDSLEPKRFINSMVPLVNPQKVFDALIPKVPNPDVVIPSIRSVIFAFALSSLLLIYMFMRSSYGILPAFICTSLIVSNPIFSSVSTRILADPILLFFFALFISICGLYLKSRRNVYIVLGFIVSSLASLTKLNGILCVFILLIIFLVKNKFSISKDGWKSLITGFSVFLLISVLLNPVFLNTGVKAVWKMVDVRWSVFRLYQESWKSVALFSISERFYVATRMIFFKYSVFYQFLKVPLELILFAAGTYYAFTKKDLLLILIFVFLVLIPISVLPFNIPRYFYWIFPFIYMIAALAPNLFKEMLSNKNLKVLKTPISSFAGWHIVENNGGRGE